MIGKIFNDTEIKGWCSEVQRSASWKKCVNVVQPCRSRAGLMSLRLEMLQVARVAPKVLGDAAELSVTSSPPNKIRMAVFVIAMAKAISTTPCSA